jgi:hypothetical protein
MRFCGVLDPDSEISAPGFGPTSGRWTHGDLTISIDTRRCNFNSEGDPGLTADDVIRGAFQQWQAASGFFTFAEVSVSAGADIPVSFSSLAVSGKLGAGGRPGSGFATIDSNPFWTKNAFMGTVLHEIGHSLGLGHALGDSIMNTLSNNRVTVDGESKEVLHLLYGWRPEQQLQDRGTTDHAVLGVTRLTNLSGHIEIPRMVWTGVVGDSSIYESELLARGWTTQQTVPGIGSSNSPALAKIDVPGSAPLLTDLIMAWKGVEDDKHLYWTRNLGNGWEDQRQFPSARSDTRPALANAGGRIYIACVGSNDDHNLYWSTYNGNEEWSVFKQINDFQATDSPALVGIGNRLFMFWKGDTDNFEAFWSVINVDEDIVWQPQKRIQFVTHDDPSHPPPPQPIGTGGALSATPCGDTILLAWRGVGMDDTIYLTVFSENAFGCPIHIPEFHTSVGPALTNWSDSILMAWKGNENDRTIHWTQS